MDWNLKGMPMKALYLIGGTMGSGKTTVSQQLKKDLDNSVFLDGDWCWDASPFQVTDETKAKLFSINKRSGVLFKKRKGIIAVMVEQYSKCVIL